MVSFQVWKKRSGCPLAAVFVELMVGIVLFFVAGYATMVNRTVQCPYNENSSKKWPPCDCDYREVKSELFGKVFCIFH